jgi:hypothetical protein
MGVWNGVNDGNWGTVPTGVEFIAGQKIPKKRGKGGPSQGKQGSKLLISMTFPPLPYNMILYTNIIIAEENHKVNDIPSVSSFWIFLNISEYSFMGQ